jgi:hypothetical protein
MQIEEPSRGPAGQTPLNVEVTVREVKTAGPEVAVSLPATVPGQDGKTGQGGKSWALVLAVVMIIAGMYVGARVNRGWIAVDDGTLGQSALRVFQGQLPHQDFTEIYTGGLSFIHAAAFHLFGVNLLALRICVFLFFLTWVPAVYYVAMRFMRPLAAGMVTLVAVAWSFPNYPSAMPSWYNLFFATFGAAALLRYLEVRTKRWLLVAGICGGISILIKVIGAYYIASVLLFLTFLEQSETQQKGAESRSWSYRIFSGGALILFLSTVVFVLHQRLGIGEFYHFLLPAMVVVGMILLGERTAGGATGERFAALMRTVLPFGCGLLIPVIVFLVPYALSGSVGSFSSGVTSSAVSHVIAMAVERPAPPQYIVAVVPLLALLAAAMYCKQLQGRAVGVAIGALAVMLVVCATRSVFILRGVWFSAVMLTPVVVVLGTIAVRSLQNEGESRKLDRQRLALLVTLAATCTLVQFPFPAPIYLCYALPLTILALAATVATVQKQRGTYVLASVLGLYLVYGVVSLIPLHIAELPHVIGQMDNFRVPRGGIAIEDQAYWETLTRFLQARSPNGLMYAGNACPELYFMTGLKNVTRYDDGAPETDVLKAIESDDLRLVVITESPYFSGTSTSPKVLAEVLRKFPNHQQSGFFQIYWRQ